MVARGWGQLVGKTGGKKKINTFLDVIECPARCGALPLWEGSSWEEECLTVGTGQGSAGVIPLRDACPVCALHPQLTWAGPWCVPWTALVATWLPRHLLCGGCTPWVPPPWGARLALRAFCLQPRSLQKSWWPFTGCSYVCYESFTQVLSEFCF